MSLFQGVGSTVYNGMWALNRIFKTIYSCCEGGTQLRGLTYIGWEAGWLGGWEAEKLGAFILRGVIEPENVCVVHMASSFILH